MNYQADENRYNKIPYNRCGKSGIQLPSVSLGLWHNFGGNDIFENGRAVCRAAFDMGITHFDLANNYGPPYGSAEENFGKILALDLKPYRDELIISSKAGYDMWPGPYGNWGSRKYLMASLDQSLKRMGLEYVDIFYSHRPDPETPMEETMGALADIVKQGKALYVGISNYNANQTLKASRILKSLGVPCLIHQPKYSMFERWIEDKLLEVLEDKGIGCIPFSPLAQGLLTDKYLNGIPESSRASKNHFLKKEAVESSLEKVKNLNEIAQARGQKLSQMALSWILKDKRITSVLIGASSISQLKENIACTNNTEFSTDEINKIDRILQGLNPTETKRQLVVTESMKRNSDILLKSKAILDSKRKTDPKPSSSRQDFIKNLTNKLNNDE